MRLIDADKLSADMYHEAFEKDSDMQKWDSGCWIRYKMFENVLKAQPTVEGPDINVGNMDTTTHDSIPAETGKNDGVETSGDCISRQAVTKFLNDWLSCLFENCHKQSASDLKMIIKDFKNLPSAQPDTTTHDSIPAETDKNDGDRTSGDCISRRQAIDALLGITAMRNTIPLDSAIFNIKKLPSAQPEQHTCVNCGRTVNNGGWYADGRTRCPIEEHYALPKDGYCHLWEKRNVTDDDYPERREE